MLPDAGIPVDANITGIIKGAAGKDETVSLLVKQIPFSSGVANIRYGNKNGFGIRLLNKVPATVRDERDTRVVIKTDAIWTD